MKLTLTILALAAFSIVSNAKRNNPRQAYEELLYRYHNDTNFKDILAEHMQRFRNNAKRTPVPQFSCEGSKSNEIPESVHALLPGDIRIVGALGDSITAGNGILAETLIDVILNERGHVYSAGGYASFDEGVITVPNILKNYNRLLYGYALGEAGADDPEAMFNVAIGGSTAGNLPAQAEDIINKMSADRNVDMSSDWKMITVFIGGNDLCRVCDDEARYGSSEYIRHMENTLNILSRSLTRAIINVVTVMDVTPLVEVSDGIICDGIQAIACGCAIDPEYADMVKRIQREYSTLAENLINSGKYDRQDFTVVFQPFLRDTKLPRDDLGDADRSYFSPDCFHFSEKGHKGMAVNLWNNMFEAVGKKTTSMTFKEEVKCPSKGQFIATRQNSINKDSQYQLQGQISDVLGFKANENTTNGVGAPVTAIAIIGLTCGLLALAGVGIILIKSRRQTVANLA